MKPSSRFAKCMLACVALVALSTPCSAFAPGAVSQRSSIRSNSQLSMSSSLMETTVRPSFEDRMRTMVLGGRKKKVATKKKVKMPANIKVAKTLGDYKDIVGGERDRIVVVRFFAPWCKACRAIQPLFYRLAYELTDVLFVEVPVTESNANLHQGLGIPSLPFGHIYSPNGGLVEELKITRPHFAKFSHKLQTYIQGSCDLEDGEVTSPYEPKKELEPAATV